MHPMSLLLQSVRAGPSTTNITRPLMLLLGSDGCWSDNLDIGRVDRYCIGKRNIDCIALEWAVYRWH